MNLETDLDLIQKMCAVKGLEKFDIDCTLQDKEEMLFTLARMFVSYGEIIHFDNSLEGAIKFLYISFLSTTLSAICVIIWQIKW